MKWISVLITLQLVLGITSCSFSEKGSNQKPNVLIIFPDQLRRYSAGYWQDDAYKYHSIGEPDPVITPSIDNLARNGVVFTNAISNFPLCSPYRGMLLTGQYPEQNGIWGNCKTGRSHGLNADIMTLTDYFHEADYNTAYFGKCHWVKTEPLFDEQGTFVGTTQAPGGHYINAFDTYVPPGPSRHNIDYFYQAIKDRHFDPLIYSNDPVVIEGKKDGELHRVHMFSAKNEAQLLIKYLRNSHNQRNTDKPFCVLWSLNPPHNPWNDENTDMSMLHTYYDTNKFAGVEDLVLRDNADYEVAHYARHYFANVSSVDQYIGTVLDELKKLGMLDNTIVIFTADHGEMLGSHGKTGKNVLETESIAIPFIVHYPGKLKPGIHTSLFGAVDVLPTVLGLAGITEKISDEIQGEDFSKQLMNTSEKITDKQAVLLMLGRERGIYTGEYTFSVVEDPKTQTIAEVYLYDNLADPYQQKRLGQEEEPELVNDMLITLGKKLKEAGDPWYTSRKYGEFIVYPD